MLQIIDGEQHLPTCLFAHGAGAPMDSDFMQTVAEGLAQNGIKVIRFEFPYMQERRESGKKRPPNRQPELLESFEAVLNSQNRPCVLIGKSMGGRMASLLAAQSPKLEKLVGVMALGYPFHPQGKPEKLRIEHLPDVQVPMAIVQGTRDALGNQEEVRQMDLPKSLHIEWLEDGDHDLKPRVKSGFTHQQHLDRTIAFCADFIKRCYS
ncbi:MAG: alpha/beta fold hydrolase [Gammaproteobacteria bacterium]|nr:alpha/beta fold hydrolase [Gammaproteobacteria bacterium]